jgi:hypothetical protein
MALLMDPPSLKKNVHLFPHSPTQFFQEVQSRSHEAEVSRRQPASARQDESLDGGSHYSWPFQREPQDPGDSEAEACIHHGTLSPGQESLKDATPSHHLRAGTSLSLCLSFPISERGPSCLLGLTRDTAMIHMKYIPPSQSLTQCYPVSDPLSLLAKNSAAHQDEDRLRHLACDGISGLMPTSLS